MDIAAENISIGVDIEEISRFEKYSKNAEHPFLKRIYTKNEIDYCFSSKNTASRLCARFCAKEALYKAFCGLGIKVANLTRFEILNNDDGVPTARFFNEHEKDFDIKVSLSHSKTNAIAQVLVFKKPD